MKYKLRKGELLQGEVLGRYLGGRYKIRINGQYIIYGYYIGDLASGFKYLFRVKDLDKKILLELVSAYESVRVEQLIRGYGRRLMGLGDRELLYKIIKVYLENNYGLEEEEIYNYYRGYKAYHSFYDELFEGDYIRYCKSYGFCGIDFLRYVENLLNMDNLELEAVGVKEGEFLGEVEKIKLMLEGINKFEREGNKTLVKEGEKSFLTIPSIFSDRLLLLRLSVVLRGGYGIELRGGVRVLNVFGTWYRYEIKGYERGGARGVKVYEYKGGAGGLKVIEKGLGEGFGEGEEKSFNSSYKIRTINVVNQIAEKMSNGRYGGGYGVGFDEDIISNIKVQWQEVLEGVLGVMGEVLEKGEDR